MCISWSRESTQGVKILPPPCSHPTVPSAPAGRSCARSGAKPSRARAPLTPRGTRHRRASRGPLRRGARGPPPPRGRSPGRPWWPSRLAVAARPPWPAPSRCWLRWWWQSCPPSGGRPASSAQLFWPPKRSTARWKATLPPERRPGGSQPRPSPRAPGWTGLGAS